MTDLERRTMAAAPELQNPEDPEEPMVKMRGYASVYGTESQDLGGFREVIAPGAFDAVLLEGQDVAALVNHDPNRLLGRVASGTLVLFSDSVGLGYEVSLPDTQEGEDLACLLGRQDISGSSFTFRIAPDGETWDTAADGTPLRTVTKVAMVRDVGPVTFPAYLTSDAAIMAARSMAPVAEPIALADIRRRYV